MPKLEYRNVNFWLNINNDAGSGSSRDLTTWKPYIPHGWFYLGPGATNSSTNSNLGVIVKELEKGVLTDVDDWIQVWNDTGSGKSTDFALWRGVGPSPKYVVVGGFFTRSYNKPTKEETTGIKAVHISALNQTEVGEMIWSDKGSGASKDGSVWDVSNPGLNTGDTGAFIPGTDEKPKVAYRLNKDQIQEKGIKKPIRRSLNELD